MTKKKRLSPFLLLRLLGVALFVYILFRINLKDVLGVLEKISFQFFILGIIFQLFVLAFKSVRWHLMNDGRRQKKYWIKSLGRFFESYAVGVVTPGRLGELLKAGHEENKDEKTGAFLRVISERGIDVGMFVLFATIAIYSGQYIPFDRWLALLFLLLSISLIILAWLILSSSKTIHLIQKLINYLPGKFSDMQLETKQYKTGTVAGIFLFSIGSNLSYFISCYFLALSVGLFLPIIEISGGVAIAGLFNMLPITIMGLGTREATFLTLFSGSEQSVILAFSFTILLVAQLGGGLVSFVVGHILLLKDKRNP